LPKGEPLCCAAAGAAVEEVEKPSLQKKKTKRIGALKEGNRWGGRGGEKYLKFLVKNSNWKEVQLKEKELTEFREGGGKYMGNQYTFKKGGGETEGI